MRSYSPQGPAVVIGPGPMTPAVKAIVIANVAVFLACFFMVSFAHSELISDVLGLSPSAVFEGGQVWRLVTYMFVHDATGFMHILFNMLALWMFGVDLERRWGTRGFVKYYAVTGIGAGVCTALVALLPYAVTRDIYTHVTIGASGAIYGLLFAWALLFPHRNMLFMFIFPLPARVAASLMGGMAFLAAITGTNGSVAEATHLAGLVVGWLYLSGPTSLKLSVQYRLTKWRMDRMRKKFNVHQGGRGGGGNFTVH
ncbi:MAG TPA: rhomboid family intramembrane serine protease [Vicinamibacterales bacterium]|nr:rhomboid family intramembrane serine protease [Vicinamibacterales bacterium]